jgi:Spy/CpxP family protein refolding chaperone
MLPDLKRLIIMTGLALAFPLGALADSPAGAPPDHVADGPGHEHGMPDCGMPPGMGHEGMFGGHERFEEHGAFPGGLHRLHLTEAQDDKIFSILHAQAPKARELHKEIGKAHRALHELGMAATYDDAKAKSLADALGKAIAESALLHQRTHHQILDVLTPEQRQALTQHHAHDGEHGPSHHDDHSPMAPQA